MCNIKGRVLEVNTPQSIEETRIAYLYNFRVDKSYLRSKHKEWLYKHLIYRILVPDAPIRKTYEWISGPQNLVVYPGEPAPPKPNPPSPQVPSVTKGNTTTIIAAGGTADVDRLVLPDRWMIWLHGTTSRPASRKHNLALSHRRAHAVETYIRQALGKGPPYYHIEPFWHGEFFARLLGKPEWCEDPLDRAVLIAFKAVYPNAGIALGPPAPVNRPLSTGEPCCAVKAYIDYLEAVQTGWALTKVPQAGVGIKDDSGDYPDATSVPHVRPDEAHTTTALRNKGFSYKRYWELYNGKDRLMLVPLVANSGPPVYGRAYASLDVNTIGSHIGYALDDARKSLNNCTSDDPLGVCKSFEYRKTD